MRILISVLYSTDRIESWTVDKERSVDRKWRELKKGLFAGYVKSVRFTNMEKGRED